MCLSLERLTNWKYSKQKTQNQNYYVSYNGCEFHILRNIREKNTCTFPFFKYTWCKMNKQAKYLYKNRIRIKISFILYERNYTQHHFKTKIRRCNPNCCISTNLYIRNKLWIINRLHDFLIISFYLYCQYQRCSWYRYNFFQTIHSTIVEIQGEKLLSL